MAKPTKTTTTSRSDDRRRSSRVAQRIREELTSILSESVGDPRTKGVMVSGVEVTEDISLARVSFVVIGDQDGARALGALKVLKRLTPMIRTRLAPRLGVRRMPEIEFRVDTGREDAAQIDSVLYEVAQELRESEARRAAEGEPEGD